MKRAFNDQRVREAVGRILRDQPQKGDGNLLLEALENVREMVAPRLVDACALQAEWGRRKLASELIEIGREEFERVTTETSLPGSRTARFGSGASTLTEPGASGAISLGKLSTRRRGPQFTPEPNA